MCLSLYIYILLGKPRICERLAGLFWIFSDLFISISLLLFLSLYIYIIGQTPNTPTADRYVLNIYVSLYTYRHLYLSADELELPLCDCRRSGRCNKQTPC